MKSPWVRITAKPVEREDLQRFLREALRLSNAQYVDRGLDAEVSTAETNRQTLVGQARSLVAAAQRQWAEAIGAVIVDLYEQGWRLAFEDGHVWGLRPLAGADRKLLRSRFVAMRDQQLAEPSVRMFLEGMEAWRLFQGRRVSIISLLRDGRDLIEKMDKCGDTHVVRPYLQFVTSTARCEHTGLRLQDIWRYFRHTWTNPYESIPGRSLQILVRDASAPHHPIIGISAVSSAAVSLGARDRFIGWDTDQVLEKLSNLEPSFVLAWAQGVVDGALDEIYSGDFLRDTVVPADKSLWSAEHAKTLLRIESEAREIHHRLASGAEYKAVLKEEGNWVTKAELPLFRAKRAAELASLIQLKSALNQAAKASAGDSDPLEMVDKDSLRRIVRVARSKTVGTEIADLTLCGAIAPYSHLAAGKLVAMLSVSPPVIEEYQRRYKFASGIIASSMAGRPIQRAAQLCFVGTSSLYGMRPNQYDRLALPASLLGGSNRDHIRFRYISDETSEGTRGVGTFHFAPGTLETIVRYVSAHRGGWRINNVFGEGTSPKLRGLRTGFEELGLDPEPLLKHGIAKNLYGVSLVSNLPEYLLGFEPTVKWLFNPAQSAEAVAAICTWWSARWARPRAQRPDIIDRIRKETLVYPIRHAGRVQEVHARNANQESLFS